MVGDRGRWVAGSVICEWIWSGWGERMGEVAFRSRFEALGADDGFGARRDTSLVVVLRWVELVAGGAVAERTCAPSIEGTTRENTLKIVDAKSGVLI